MQPGRMDRRITLLQRSLARNSAGEQVATYTELATVWGQRLDVTGREFFTSQTTIAEGSARFRIRYRSDLTTVDRLSEGGLTYDIQQIAELGRQDGLELVAVARVP